MFLQSIIRNAKRVFQVNLSIFLFVLGTLGFHQSIMAHDCASSCSIDESAQRLGKALVNAYWNDVKNGNVCAFSKKITRCFHGINIEGIYNKCDQVTGLSNLTITAFKVENLIAVRYQNTLEISYDFIAEGQGIVSGPSIDIWHKSGKQWKLISHTYVPFLIEKLSV